MTDSQTLKYEPKIGDRIDDTLQVVIAMVIESGKPVVTPHSWDGKDFVVQPGETYGDAMQRWGEEWDRRSKATEATPEWQAAMAKQAEELAACQELAQIAMAQMNEVDFTSHLAVIDWLVSIRQAAADSRVTMDRERIMLALRGVGYEAGANCGPEFNPDDEDNFARYLVGQAMSDGRCIINPRHVEEWLSRFGHAAKRKNK